MRVCEGLILILTDININYSKYFQIIHEFVRKMLNYSYLYLVDSFL